MAILYFSVGQRQMIDLWGRSVEQILLATLESEARVLGLVSAEGNAGVTTLSAHVANAAQRAGWRMLLADFSSPIVSSDEATWSPADGAARFIRPDPGGFDILQVRATAESRALYNHVSALQRMLKEDLKMYDRIVVDLPAVLHCKSDLLNPLAAARSCDMVVLVCMPGQTTRNQIESAMRQLDTAGVNLGGVVLNDKTNLPVGAQIALSARKLARWSKRLSGWVQRKALASEFLNTPL